MSDNRGAISGDPKAAARSVEEAQKASAKSKKEQLRSEREAADADTEAYYERVSAGKPTPTQEENDRAKLGFDTLAELDDKEDDGSGSEAEVRLRAAKAEVDRAEAAAKKK